MTFRIRLSILTSVLSVFSLLLFAPLVFAATEETVTATATVSNISLTVSDAAVAYGTLTVSTTQDTTNTGVDDSQTATNNGNVAEDFNIRGVDSANWTLSATAGSEQYTHKFCNNGTCDGTPTWTALTTTYQTLATAVATSGTQEFDLELGTPTTTANYTQQSVNAQVQAVEN